MKTPRAFHWWHSLLMDAYYGAEQAWWLHREAVALGYPTEMREFAETHPRPTLKAFMLGLAGTRPEDAPG